MTWGAETPLIFCLVSSLKQQKRQHHPAELAFSNFLDLFLFILYICWDAANGLMLSSATFMHSRLYLTSYLKYKTRDVCATWQVAPWVNNHLIIRQARLKRRHMLQCFRNGGKFNPGSQSSSTKLGCVWKTLQRQVRYALDSPAHLCTGVH